MSSKHVAFKKHDPHNFWSGDHERWNPRPPKKGVTFFKKSNENSKTGNPERPQLGFKMRLSKHPSWSRAVAGHANNFCKVPITIVSKQIHLAGIHGDVMGELGGRHKVLKFGGFFPGLQYAAGLHWWIACGTNTRDYFNKTSGVMIIGPLCKYCK